MEDGYHGFIDGGQLMKDIKKEVIMKERKGAVLVFGLFFILILFAMMGYMYEIGRMSIAKIRAQNAADASAMAAQAVLSNLRNIATTHYATCDIFRKIAVTSSKVCALNYHLLWYYSWDKKDVYIKNLPDETSEEYVKNYHRFLHLQDFGVTRFLAAYDSKIFFRDFLKEEAKNDFNKIKTRMRVAGNWLSFYNIYNENVLEDDESGFVIISFNKEPSWSPDDYKVDYGNEVKGPLNNPDDEKEMDKKLGRAYSKAFVVIPPSKFLMRTFFTRNWAMVGSIKEPYAFLENVPLYIRAEAAAGSREFPLSYGINTPLGFVGQRFNWYFPEIVPTIKVENEPLKDYWPYH